MNLRNTEMFLRLGASSSRGTIIAR